MSAERVRLEDLLGRLTQRYAHHSLKKAPRGKAGARHRVRKDDLQRTTARVFARLQSIKSR